MTDQPQKWIFVAPETFGDWTCGEWSTEGDGDLRHSDVQVLYALAKDMIPRAEADAMVAAVVDSCAEVLEECGIDGNAFAQTFEEYRRGRASFEHAVREAVEAEMERCARIAENVHEYQERSPYAWPTAIAAAIRAPQEASE